MVDINQLLIVDDSEDDRELYRRLLSCDKQFNWVITEAEDGVAALGLLAEQNCQFDVMLLDYSLPGKSGLDLIPLVLQSAPFLAIVMLTGQGNEAIATQAIKGGACDYLSKNHISTTSLSVALHNAIAHATMRQKVDEQQQSLQSYAYVLAHDLHAPLRHILKFTDSLSAAIAEQRSDDSIECLNYIRRAAGNMSHLIKTLTQYNKIDGGEVDVALWPMRTLVDEACFNLAASIEEREAKLSMDPALPTIHGNKPQLIQLLQNLIGNAIKYCDGQPSIHIAWQDQETAWCFSVCDNGIGIPPQHQNKVFEMFRRLHVTESDYAGSGIGLATCKKIIDRHRGRIWCESEVGQGSQFFFTLAKPVEEAGEFPVEHAGGEASAQRSGG